MNIYFSFGIKRSSCQRLVSHKWVCNNIVGSGRLENRNRHFCGDRWRWADVRGEGRKGRQTAPRYVATPSWRNDSRGNGWRPTHPDQLHSRMQRWLARGQRSTVQSKRATRPKRDTSHGALFNASVDSDLVELLKLIPPTIAAVARKRAEVDRLRWIIHSAGERNEQSLRVRLLGRLKSHGNARLP